MPPPPLPPAELQSLPLVPAADIALLWHTHLALASQYAAACAALARQWGPQAGAGDELVAAPQQSDMEGLAAQPAVAAAAAAGPWPASYLDLPPGAQLQAAYARTSHLYEMEYGG